MSRPGEGVALGILELDWPSTTPIHDHLPWASPAGARGHGFADHALATAGVLLSRAPTLPGICPYARVHLACPGRTSLARALDDLARRLPDGGVLLVEATYRSPTGELPLDHDPEVAPVLASHAERLVIVLPAGNGGFDLGSKRSEGVWYAGACNSDGAWRGTTNHGPCVDLHERGDGIPTLGWGSTRVDYRDTSAAAARIAGLAVLAQQQASHHLGHRLTPCELLERIRATGTPATRHDLDPPIGILPNLDRFEASLQANRQQRRPISAGSLPPSPGTCHEL